MSSNHQLVSIQTLPVPLDKAWDFFSDPNNLLTITPPFLNLKVSNDLLSEEVYPGQIITYRVRPFAGLTVNWVTEITHMEKGKRFVDEQRKGPYALWHHQHHFKSVQGGTEMTDIVHYQLPMGVLGDLAHAFVKKKLREIFEFRFHRIHELFGQWPGQTLRVSIDGSSAGNP